MATKSSCFSSTLTFLLLSYFLILYTPSTHSSCSRWEPFCKEDVLFKPYIHVWTGGQEKTLAKSRGPGFMSLQGKRDLYICVNGLAMFYYTRTSGKGDLYEEGQLQYLPHHCQLYNPSLGPSKIPCPRELKAILLIGHPVDYRNPAMQVFIAPYYDAGDDTFDRPGRGYVNLTSLLMINAESECILVKGKEEAKLRVSVREPEAVEKWEPLDDKPATFCKLNTMFQLGQDDDPNAIPLLGYDLNEEQIFKDTELNPFKVLEALMADDEMRFVGCLKYPDFSEEQRKVIVAQHLKYNKDMKTLEDDTNLNPGTKSTSTDPNKMPSPFWRTVFKGTERYLRPEYEDFRGPPKSTLEEAEKAWKEAVDAIKTHKESGGDPAQLPELMEKEYEAYATYHILPYKSLYSKAFDHAKEALENKIIMMWPQLYEEIDKEKLNETLGLYLASARNASELSNDRRFNAYDPQLFVDYEKAKENRKNYSEELRSLSLKYARKITTAEVLTASYWRFVKYINRLMDITQSAIVKIERRRHNIKDFRPLPWPTHDISLAISSKSFPKPREVCDHLPSRISSCNGIKPSSMRACQLYQNRIGKGSKWNATDEWRGKVFDLVSTVFHKVCPYLADDFATSIHRIVRGYLLGEPQGTGLGDPVHGSRLYAMDVSGKMYVEKVANSTFGELSPKRPFWDQIIRALETCVQRVEPMEFYQSVEEEDGKSITEFRKRFPNGTYSDIPMEELYLAEQADREYSLNWAVEMSWRLFATTLGACMHTYETKIPLISFKFYSMYYEDFLHPLRQIWMSNRDNPLLQQIFGSVYPSGKGDAWTKNCMESSFVAGGDVQYRPVRWLYVNAFTELNYFVNGPMAGTSGVYFK